jgi:hypothetical protein
MDSSFSGQSIPVTGPEALSSKDTVWFSEVRIFKSTKSGGVTYDMHCQHPTNGDEVDAAVRAALQAVVQELTASAAQKP